MDKIDVSNHAFYALMYIVLVLQTWCVFVLLSCSIKGSEGSILL